MQVKISSIIENQFPAFIKDEAPLMVEFIKQYYVSQEYQGAPIDLITNLDEYTKIENLTELISSTTLSADISFNDTTIPVDNTRGFPDSYGLIKIDGEIVTYTSKTDTSFEGCVRGFSGLQNENLEFSTSESDFHSSGAIVENLSILFLSKFLEKLKKKLVPGFEGREFSDALNQTNFIQKSRSFYTSKGTDTSFEILFGALYGEPVQVIRPRDYLFTPSAAEYRVSQDLVAEALFGDPLLLENRTLFQDSVDGNNLAKGSISKVEQILRGDKTYYVISLDYDFNKDINVSGSVFGKFYIHPKTQLTSRVLSDSTTIDVDSTAGFPNSGIIVINNQLQITYTSKSTTQFFGCSGVTSNLEKGSEATTNDFAYGYSGNDTSNIVAVRITGVIKNFRQIEDAHHLNVGDNVRIKSLGKTSTNVRATEWLYNNPIRYNVKSLSNQLNTYTLETVDDNIFIVGDSINVVYKDGTTIPATVSFKTNKSTIVFQSETPVVLSSIFYVERQISRVSAAGYSSVNTIASNVQHVYEDVKQNVIISAPSLPSYPLTVTNRGLQFNSFVGTGETTIIPATNHGFENGDVVVYDYSGSINPLGITKGTYYTIKNNVNSLSLATSRANLSSITFRGSAGIGTGFLNYNDFHGKSLNHQKLFRKISAAQETTTLTATPIGNTGILVNGVEIVNYKSKDAVFYGPVESIDVVSPGSDYDVINPPVITVTDETGSGLIANCEVRGSLKEIRLLDRGLNYIAEPTITISGGNGKNAKAKAELALFEHSATFNSSSITSNTIGFTTYHGFNTAEKIIYKPDGASMVTGISTDAEYFASRIDASSIKLHKTYSDALSGSNPVTLSYTGFAAHRFISASAKTKISRIVITDEGESYTNRKVSIPSSGINTATNTIIKTGHGFKTGERIVYQSYTGTPISGISTNTPYYVTEIEDGFKLSEVSAVGISTSDDFLFKTGQFITFTSSGTGIHYFNYEPITVSMYGISGVNTIGGATFLAKIQPIFRGEITSASVVDGGQNYGQEDILNYNRQPNISISSGSDAAIQAIVSGGKIVQVLIINSGSGYNAPPTILISGTGYNAELTPVVKNGQLTDVKIINSGFGYDSKNITLTVVPAGSGGLLKTNPKQWTVNLVERLINSNKITEDDGILTRSINSEFGLQYTHGYAPRKLRQLLNATKFVSGELRYQPDLQLDESNGEVASDSHSPIIGWAYDGNPIYGPYGFDTETGGSIRFMKSGYSAISGITNRPDTSLYPIGFFIEDYQFTGNGDLDEHNGRYCITPDFPNGTYAYFATVDGSNKVAGTSPFVNYFRPVFPYFIGNTYNSKIIDYNFDYKSNQDLIELNDTGWIRNTAPLKLGSSSSTYSYLFKPFDIIEQTATITSTLAGSVESVNLISGGSNYKVKDKIIFDASQTGTNSARAEVFSIKGKDVSSISVASTSFYNVEFVPNQQYGIIGFSSIPHSFESGDIVSVKNLNHNKNILENSFNISVTNHELTLNTDVNVIALTGVTTYFNVYGNLSYPFIRENDVFLIDGEKVQVLNVDNTSSRLFVKRAYGGTVGSYHTVGAALTEVTRKFFLSKTAQDFTNSSINRELYFNPADSLGIGIGTTVTFANPGSGITSVFIPTRSIYLPQHGLNTGEKLTYKMNGGSEFTVSTNGITTSLLSDNSTLYAVKYSDNFIGLSTQQVGVGTTGNFVGFNTTSAAKILYYNSLGSGQMHSLLTNYDSTIGEVERNVVSVFPKTDSGLVKGDAVSVSVKPKTSETIKIVYNSATQRILARPRAFLAADVDIAKETIELTNHRYYTGQKVLYTATTPIGGLSNNGIYYVVVINSNKISLSRSYYDATLNTPNIVKFSSASAGTIYEVNPKISVVKNNTLTFDLSDSSLSVLEGAQNVSAFDFAIFTDSQFINNFKTTFSETSFNVTSVGKIGIDANATLSINYDDAVPNELYYNLIPLKTLKVFVDGENNPSHNLISFVNSAYSGTYTISGIGSTSFSYSINSYPESGSYSSDVTYTTNSRTATGSIEDVSIISGGSGYKTLPGVSSVVTETGSGAIFTVESQTIGRINNVNLNDIGFDYPSDLTLVPLTQTPIVLKVLPLSTLKSVGITSQGKNYIVAPELILLDGLTLERVPSVDIRYNLGDSQVTIVKNSKGINNVEPIIIPVNNSNAIGINSITFNSTTKIVTIVLSESYSTIEEFPFAVGDKILVENVVILADSSAKGYNSSAYDYARFTVTSINPNLGFAGGSLTYDLSSYLTALDYPGTQNPAFNSGTVTPEKFFPLFKTELTKNSFLRDETVTATDVSGVVQFWNQDNELLTLSTSNEFRKGIVITGSDSLSSGTVDTVYNFESRYEIDSSSIVRKGWQTEKGFLDNEFQRIQDNNYYQAFSYSLKSKVDYDTWNNAVSSLNHIAGFKKFSDLVIESVATGSIGSESTADLTITNYSEVNLNCIEDFDLATENNYLIGNQLGSNEVYFRNQILQDYSEVVGNRVLTIDNISSGFNDSNREFELKCNNLNIFSRSFNGSSPSVVDISNNLIQLSNHYFTNGEKVTYSHNGQPIGIITATIPGIGSTDKLPSSVYVIKYSESTIGLAGSAENALKEVPAPLVFSSVGIGSTHTLTSTNQNTKALISMGGIIQAPVVSTAISTRTSLAVGIASTVIFFNSIANFASGDSVKIDDEILKVVTIGIAATNDVQVNRGWAGTAITTHLLNSTVYKLSGDYNIVGNKLHFLDPPKGPAPIGTTTGSPENVDFAGITTTLNFHGRVFLRNGQKDTTNDAYYSNYVFDDISNSFNGITTSFNLKVNQQNVTGFAGNNGSLLIGEVFQSPSDFSGLYKTYGAYTFEESSGITSVRFLGASTPQNYDVNVASIPIGGVIVSIGYTQGFGLQPLVAAGGTATVSTAGTIQSISIGNSGSGYRSGLQTVNVGIYVSTTGISSVRNIGIASILNGNVISVAITNPGTGYTNTNPPLVKFDEPLPYTNLPLNYVSPSTGVGTGAKVNVKVGLGLSIIDLEVVNKGFAYKKGDVLSVSIGGTVGIPTVSTASYAPLKILVDEVYNQKFSSWTFGELQIIDSIENLFNGQRKSFPIKVDTELRSIRARTGSPIDIKSTLLVFVNGILQIPGEGYNFTGSSFITFTEAPETGSSCLILFYRGTGDTDVVDVDVISTVKPGDTLQLKDSAGLGQKERIITSVNSADSVNTIPYNGPNVSSDDAYVRPLNLCRQTEDIIINQKQVPKDREIYEPLVEPATNVIKTVGITSTIIFVENARTFFDDQRENTLTSYRNKLKIVTQDEIRPAIATATVSIAGTISSVTIIDGGKGYTTPPIISFANPIGMTTTSRAYGTATVTSGSISSITITSPGTGYTSSIAPQVLVGNPINPFENITATSITGDFGIISGIASTSVGIASTGLIFNLYIPPESALRNVSIAGAAITVSGIQTGYYFVVNNTFVGNGITSLDGTGSVISTGSSYINNVYRVANVSIGQSFVAGIGTTTVSQVTVSVISNNNVTGIGYTRIYGTYSWGRITISARKTTNEFAVYQNGLSGISTSPIVKRINPLKSKSYT